MSRKQTGRVIRRTYKGTLNVNEKDRSFKRFTTIPRINDVTYPSTDVTKYKWKNRGDRYKNIPKININVVMNYIQNKKEC